MAQRLDNLQDLFVQELKDLYNAERQIQDALPKMSEKASHQELKSALDEHLRITGEHVRRLEQIFDTLQESPTGMKCKGMEGIIDESKDLMKQDGDSSVRDAGIIGQAQRVEHYEISGYGTARTYAERLGFGEAARMLQQTLQEEEEADKRLTSIAEQIVNPDAQQGGHGGRPGTER
jgi:ferritin-like metal-binding protein YciE